MIVRMCAVSTIICLLPEMVCCFVELDGSSMFCCIVLPQSKIAATTEFFMLTREERRFFFSRMDSFFSILLLLCPVLYKVSFDWRNCVTVAIFILFFFRRWSWKIHRLCSRNRRSFVWLKVIIQRLSFAIHNLNTCSSRLNRNEHSATITNN